MNTYSRFLTTICIYTILFLTTITACKDSISTQAPPQADNQASNTTQQDRYKSQKAKTFSTIEGEYIVIFDNQFKKSISKQVARQADQLQQEVLSSHSISKDSVFSKYRYAIKGFAAKLSDKQAEALEKDPQVASIFPNALLRLGISPNKNRSSVERFAEDKKRMSSPALMAQTTPWGISRVGGPLDGTGKTAWILDTGIDLDHPDLNVDINNGISYIPNESPNDGHGHGTHVAGIIAAKDNTQGVIGVATEASVVPVKVCYDEPPAPGEDQCPISSLLDGIEYVLNNAGAEDVVNISIWGPAGIEGTGQVENAIINAADNGIKFTLIAGNAGENANGYSPGRINHSNIWTMSAYDNTDTFASLSNFGNPPIDYGGPGVDVLSLWINGGTNTIGGTSMAAPHIAGLLLAASYGIDTDGTVNNDPDGNADPIAVAASEPTLNVTISGPKFLASDQVGTWSANVSNNDGPVSYKWYRRDTPNDPWVQNGGSDTYSTYFYNPGSSPQQSGVKVEATSAGETDSAILPVIISDR